MMRPLDAPTADGEELWQCEEHPHFVGPEAAAAVHLQLFHPELWRAMSRTTITPVAPS